MKKIIILFVFLSLNFSAFSQVQSLIWREDSKSCLVFAQPNDLDAPFPYNLVVGNLENDFYGYSIFTDNYGNIKYCLSADSVYFNATNYSISNYNIDDRAQSMLVMADTMENHDFYFVDIDGNFKISQDFTIAKYVINKPVLPKFTVMINGPDTIFALHHKYDQNYLFYVKSSGSDSVYTVGSDTYANSELGFYKFSVFGDYFAASYPGNSALDIIDSSGTYFNLNTAINGYDFNAIEFAPFVNSSSGDVFQILYAANQYSIYQIYIRSGGIVELNLNPIGYSGSPIIDMHLSPDGRIFVAKEDGTIGIIESPEIVGLDCHYIDTYIYATEQIHPFPNVVRNIMTDYTTFYWQPELVVKDQMINFMHNGSPSIDSTKWYIDGSYVANFSGDYTFPDLGFHEIKVKTYYMPGMHPNWDSVTYIKHVNVKGLVDDIILCDTLDSVQLLCNMTNAFEYYWLGPELDTVTSENYIWVTKPGVYNLQINVDSSNILYDTANVIYFEPYFVNVPDTLGLGQTLTAQVDLNITPPGTLDPHDFYYTWFLNTTNIGEGIDIMSNNVYFDVAGLDTINVSADGLGCTQDVYKEIQVIDSIAHYHLDSHNLYICDTATLFSLKIIPTPSTDDMIIWNLPDGNTIYDVSEIQVNTPGKYTVEIYDANIIYHTDTCIVHYDLCENLNIAATVNGLPAITFCDQTDSYSFIADVGIIDTSCYTDHSFWDFRWDFDDGNIISGNFDVENYNFSEPGSYNVNFFLLDAKGCSHYASTPVFTTVSNDSIVTINATEKNSYGEYIIDIRQLGLFEQIIPKKSFYKVDFDQIIPPGTSYFYITVDTNIDLSIDLDQVKIMLDIALASPFDFTIFTPDSQRTSLLHYSGTGNPLFGFPVLGYSDIEKAIPQTYFLKYDGYNFSDYISTAETTNYYYQPNDSTALGAFYHLAPLTEFNMENTLSAVKVGGNWRIEITNNDPNNHGYLKSIGILFPPNFAKISILPDSVICSDSYGNTFRSNYDNMLYLTYQGMDQVTYNCKAFYKGCVVDKELVVNFLPGADTFTPNGDGHNDYWIPVSFNTNAEIIIMDKTGTIVDQFNTLDRPEGWAGYYMNGKVAPNDSYWAIIILEDGTVIKKIVNIIR